MCKGEGVEWRTHSKEIKLSQGKSKKESGEEIAEKETESR